MVAAALVATIAVGVAQIVDQSIRASVVARGRTVATVLALQKMEQLRSLAWSEALDPTTGVFVPSSDLTTDLSTDPITSGGPGLAPSPATTLEDNAPPYVDYLDALGSWVGNGPAKPPEAVYIRRWSVQPLEAHPADALVLQVLVTTVSGGSPRPMAGDVRLVSVKTRRAR